MYMEICLSQRAAHILEFLLEQRDYVNAAQIESRMNITSTQVRYSLDRLEHWLAFRDLVLVRKPRCGVRIEGYESRKAALSSELKNILRQSLSLSSYERMQLLLLQLLITAKPLRLEEISNWLKISRPTLFRDIADVRAWIVKRGLSLTQCRNQGYSITGREILWRNSVLELLVSNLNQGTIIACCANLETDVVPCPPDGFLRCMNDFLDELPLYQVEGLVTAIEEKTKIQFPDNIRVRLILSLGLALYRLALGKYIPADEYGDLPQSAQEIVDAASETRNRIEAWLRKAIPPGEIHYIEECLQDAIESLSRTATDRDADKNPMIDIYADVTAELVRASAQYLHPGLLHDLDFSECLRLVLAQAADGRTVGEKFEMITYPPLREEKEPLTRFVRRQLGSILEDHGYKPSQHLLDAITVHLDTALERQRLGASQRKVWVVCGAGLATARNLVSRLNMHMPELKILGIASSFEIIHDPALARGADAVISTIKINLDGVLVIQVSPLGTPEDMRRIQRLLGLWKGPQPAASAGNHNPAGVSLNELLKEETVDIVDRAESWGEVVELAGGLLLKAGAIWPSYTAAIKDMIVLYGPYMVIAPGVALLHAGPEMGAKRLAVSLVLLKKPVTFGHPTFDPVRVAMAFASVDHCSHLQTVGEIMSLMGDEASRERVARSATKGEIIANVLAA